MNRLSANRHFAGLWAASSISNFGTQLGALSLTALVYLDASAAQMGVLAAAASAPVLLLSLFAGVWIDRVPRGPVLVFADLGRFAALATLPVAALLGDLQIWQLYSVAFCTGALNVLFELAYHAVLPSIVPAGGLVDANSRLRMSEAVAESVGPAAGGAIVQAAGGPVAIGVDALTFLASGVIVGRVDWPEGNVDVERRRAMLVEAVEGVRAVMDRPVLRAILGQLSTSALFGGFFMALYGIWVVRELDFSPLTLGVLIGAGGVGSLAGSLLSGRLTRRFGLGTCIVRAQLLAGALTLLVPLAGGPSWVAFAMLLVNQLFADTLWGVHAIGTTSLRQAITPAHQLGRANATFLLANHGLLPLGALIAGAAAGLFGVQATLLIGALGINAAGLWLVFSPVGKVRQAALEPS